MAPCLDNALKFGLNLPHLWSLPVEIVDIVVKIYVDDVHCGYELLYTYYRPKLVWGLPENFAEDDLRTVEYFKNAIAFLRSYNSVKLTGIFCWETQDYWRECPYFWNKDTPPWRNHIVYIFEISDYSYRTYRPTYPINHVNRNFLFTDFWDYANLPNVMDIDPDVEIAKIPINTTIEELEELGEYDYPNRYFYFNDSVITGEEKDIRYILNEFVGFRGCPRFRQWESIIITRKNLSLAPGFEDTRWKMFKEFVFYMENVEGFLKESLNIKEYYRPLIRKSLKCIYNMHGDEVKEPTFWDEVKANYNFLITHFQIKGRR